MEQILLMLWRSCICFYKRPGVQSVPAGSIGINEQKSCWMSMSGGRHRCAEISLKQYTELLLGSFARFHENCPERKSPNVKILERKNTRNEYSKIISQVSK